MTIHVLKIDEEDEIRFFKLLDKILSTNKIEGRCTKYLVFNTGYSLIEINLEDEELLFLQLAVEFTQVPHKLKIS